MRLRRTISVIVLGGAILGSFLRDSRAEGKTDDKAVVYSGAALIDGTGAALQPDMAIVTKGERIVSVLPAAELKPPADAEIVNVAARFVLPGLINSHTHLALPPDRKFAEAMLRRNLYAGVTAVRSMGDDLRALNELARAARMGEIPGPDIFSAALFAGRDFFSDPRMLAASQGIPPGHAPWMQAIDENTDLATAVTLARGAGATGIKIYADLSADLVRKIVAEAHRQNLPAWAHGAVFPATPQEVVDAGPDTVSHIGYLGYQAMAKRPASYEERDKFPLDPELFAHGENPAVTSLFASMREKGVILDATNFVFHTIERMRKRNPQNAPPPPYCSSELAERLCAQAHHSGVLISTGTDSFAEMSDSYPALPSEMEILVRKVGMTPFGSDQFRDPNQRHDDATGSRDGNDRAGQTGQSGFPFRESADRHRGHAKGHPHGKTRRPISAERLSPAHARREKGPFLTSTFASFRGHGKFLGPRLALH